MKKLFSILLILALCLTAFTACGGKTEPSPVPTAAPTAEPAAEPTVEPTAEPTAEPTTAPSEADPIAAYADVFATYTTLLTEGWGGEELMAHDLPLLIGTLASDEFYAPIVFEMYTLNPEGSVVRVFSSQERARYYLCDDNSFLFEGANSAADSVRCFYSYAAGTLTEIPDAGAQPQTLSYIPFSQLNF